MLAALPTRAAMPTMATGGASGGRGGIRGAMRSRARAAYGGASGECGDIPGELAEVEARAAGGASGGCGDIRRGGIASSGGGRAKRARAGAVQYSSSRTWALTPPKPKPLTAARRALSAGRGHWRGADSTSKGLSCRAMVGGGRSKWAVGGRVRCCMARQLLIREAAPAAVSRWPTLPFTEPSTAVPVTP